MENLSIKKISEASTKDYSGEEVKTTINEIRYQVDQSESTVGDVRCTINGFSVNVYSLNYATAEEVEAIVKKMFGAITELTIKKATESCTTTFNEGEPTVVVNEMTYQVLKEEIALGDARLNNKSFSVSVWGIAAENTEQVDALVVKMFNALSA